MIVAQVGALLLFAAVAIVKVVAGDAPAGSIDPALSWFSPFAVDSLNALVLGLLTGVFIYWGWESAVNLNEETEDSDTAPGLAAVVLDRDPARDLRRVTVAVVAFAGLDRVAEFEDDPGIFGAIADDVLGTELELDRRAGDHHVGARLDADHDPARIAHLALDGAPGRVPRAARPRAPALPHAARLDDRDRRDRGGLVRRPQHRLAELPVRLAHRAVADDRLLLRAHRLRVRDLLPARAHEVGEELLLHRRRAGGRRVDPRLPLLQGDRRVREGRRLVHAAARSSGSPSRWCSASGCCCSASS